METGERDGPQHGGNCTVLASILKMDNAALTITESLYVQDTFGCVCGKEKD